ncbi:MAG: hypothetical protein GY720_04670 [bacterium]|nr:hypothetical protein [bacterium]
MTATLNTGAETIRINRSYMPLLMQLKTTGAVGADAETTAALDRLEAGELLRDGNLHPMADAMLETVAEPGLVVSVERMRLGSIAASTIWATPLGATIGTRVEGGLYELKLASTALLPFHLFQLIHLRPLPQDTSRDVTLRAEAMLSAEARLYSNDESGANAELVAAGVDPVDAESVVAALAARVASWRIHSLWSSADGTETHEAHGMDCGRLGHVLVTIGTEEPTMRLRSATFAEVTAEVRAALPAS